MYFTWTCWLTTVKMRVRNKFRIPFDRLTVATINQLAFSVYIFSTWLWHSRSKSKLRRALRNALIILALFFLQTTHSRNDCGCCWVSILFLIEWFCHWLRHTHVCGHRCTLSGDQQPDKKLCNLTLMFFIRILCVCVYYWIGELGLESASVWHTCCRRWSSFELLLLALIYRMHSLGSDFLHIPWGETPLFCCESILL